MHLSLMAKICTNMHIFFQNMHKICTIFSFCVVVAVVKFGLCLRVKKGRVLLDALTYVEWIFIAFEAGNAEFEV